MKRLALVVLSSLLTVAADARVLSYAPVTSSSVVPAVQHRANRHYALIELEPATPGTPVPGFVPCPTSGKGRLVVYDATGAEEPRAVFPPGGQAQISAAAALETGGVLYLLIQTDAEVGGGPAGVRTLYSPDGGATWKRVPVPVGFSGYTAQDVGGPLVRGAGSQILPGTRDVPFVLAAGGDLYAVQRSGEAVPLARGSQQSLELKGYDRGGTRFVVSGRPLESGVALPNGLYSVDLTGKVRLLLLAPPGITVSGAWLGASGAPSGALYLDAAVPQPAAAPFTAPRAIYLVEDLRVTEVARPLPGAPPYGSSSLFAVPTADFTGAWIVQRGDGQPTVLSRHTADTGLVTQWSDITGPELEAVHAGASGETLLLQVHRPRPQADQRIFRDPALALWRVGEPAPRVYDELFLVEQPTKGFVHLEVDALASGAPFVFDSGTGYYACVAPPTGGGPSPGPGGADVVQEWGAVRASLRQKLVIPAVARSSGAFGSDWTTELVLYNPDDDPVQVGVSYIPSGAEVWEQRIALVTLGSREIKVVPDVLGSLFQLPRGSGALVLQPAGDGAIAATSRTVTATPAGTFGMGVGAVDVHAAAGPRFPLLFSGALLGTNYRSNLAVVDASGRGLGASLTFNDDGLWKDLAFTAPAGGHTQLNDLASQLGLPMWETGAVTLQATSGEAIPALIVIDNRTNDPTYFPPDLPAPYTRTIPALVHADGAAGARFRSDLMMTNPADEIATVTMAAKPWTSADAEKIVTFTLLPRESKLVKDALPTIFGLSGVARLRYVSGISWFAVVANGVRVTSRTYTLLPDGGTYGLLIPPLNSFQSAGPGEALEILGARGGAGFRTNLSLVDLTAFADGGNVRVGVEVVDGHGRTLDSFETTVPTAGGRQIDDLFRARALGDGPEAALIRVRPFGGLVAAYATLIDQGTNDPIYLPAGLASR